MAWGVAVYKNDVDYAANARVIFAVDGLTYKAKAANGPSTAVALPSDETKWERWGHSDSELGSVFVLDAGQVMPDTGTVSGAILHKVGKRAEISFYLSCADYTHVSPTVTLTAEAFTALTDGLAIVPHATPLKNSTGGFPVVTIAGATGGESSRTFTFGFSTSAPGDHPAAYVTVIVYSA